jgi:hypothetical protein
MAHNPFEELLREFQAAYARFGNELFFLFAVTPEERDADPGRINEWAECLGFVPLGDDAGAGTPGYYIFGPLRRFRLGRWAERWEEPFKAFAELAAQAGAVLPVRVRDTIKYAPADPTAWWLAFMWSRKPPSANDLRPPDGKLHNTRVVWAEPFLEAADIIERSGLWTPSGSTDSPATPAGPATPPGPSGAETPKSNGSERTYSVADLREMTGLKNDALNRYAQAAGVETPGRGKRNFRYSLADVPRILNEIISRSNEVGLVKRCKTALKHLPEIRK